MGEIIYQKSYQEYKAELDGELQRTAEGFVRIGYLLKVARDTNVLAESGYTTVAEFAEAEYNLNKTQVSRFMSINDKFSEGGYSDHLLPSYQGFGYAKLTIMLQLPDSINEELSPNYSKAEIQAIKEEVDEEHRTTDIERYLEASTGNTEAGLAHVDEYAKAIDQTILQLGEDDPELYVEIAERRDEDLSIVLPEIMAPAGERTYSVRVKGIGRLLLIISDMSDEVKLVNSRSGEKESYTWADIAAAWVYAGILGSGAGDRSGIACWEQQYGRKYPVAPVQPEKKQAEHTPARKKAAGKEIKVKKAPAEWASSYHKGQQVQVIADGRIGELVGKTAVSGKWKVTFATHTAELEEAQFEEYIEPPAVQEQLHDVLAEVPKIQEVESGGEAVEVEETGETEETEGAAVEGDEKLPGQMEIADYPEAMPVLPVQENTRTEKERRRAALENLERAVIYLKNWKEADYIPQPMLADIIQDVDAAGEELKGITSY